MIRGIGIDSVSISRMGKVSEGFIRKYFHEAEQADYAALSEAHDDIKNRFLASRFAVKEAYAKAVGKGFSSDVIPNEICTKKNESGAPYVCLYGKTLKQNGSLKCYLSITHEADLAIAVVVIEED